MKQTYFPFIFINITFYHKLDFNEKKLFFFFMDLFFPKIMPLTYFFYIIIII